MPEWRSPVNVLLRSGARASGALQQGLDRAALIKSGLGAFDPVFWIRLTTEIFLATLRFPPPLTGSEPDQTTPRVPRVPAPPVPSEPVSPTAGVSTLRPEALQALIDQDVHFQIFSIPEKANSRSLATTSGGELAEFHIKEAWHRFNIVTSAPTNCAPLTAGNTVGERVGAGAWRWMFSDDRFAMVDGLIEFGDVGDGFRATGVGGAASVTIRGRKQLLITATGAVSEGLGKFRNHEDGIFIYCGILDPARGFQGTVTLRVADRQGTLQTTDPLPPLLQLAHNPEQGVTWLTIRAQAVPSAPVAPLADGQPGAIFQQDARLVDIDFTPRGPKGLECAMGVRQAIGKVTSHVAFDANGAAGTPNNPLPFAVWREFSFFDSLNKPLGGFTAQSSDGIAFVTDVSGARGFRFGGTGRILEGSGLFDGMSGVVTENTLAVLDPYAGSSVYTLRVDDPFGRFSARDGVWRDIPVSEVTALTK
jgi:hypothetical protein